MSISRLCYGMGKKRRLSFFYHVYIQLGFGMRKQKNGPLSNSVSQSGSYVDMGKKNWLVELLHVCIRFVACYGEAKMVS